MTQFEKKSKKICQFMQLYSKYVIFNLKNGVKMTRIEKINSYYEKRFAELEKLHSVLNNAVKKNVNADNYKILGWESRQAQYGRFGAFVKNVELDNTSVFDVGCGLGDLYHFMTSGFDLSIDYVGIDLSQKMIDLAKSQLQILKDNGLKLSENNLSKVLFIQGDIFDKDELIKKGFASKNFDWVYSSGIFNLNLGNNFEFLENAFIRFLQLSKKGFACSMLNIRSKDKEDEYFYYNPSDVKNLAIKCGAKNVQIIDDYLENDFTIIASKE